MFDAALAVEWDGVVIDVPSLGATYLFAAPGLGGANCTVSGGLGAAALSACTAFEQASLVQLCTSPTSETPSAVLVRADAGRTVTPVSLAELIAVAGPAGIEFRALTCQGTGSLSDRFVLRADGTAYDYLEGADIPANEIAAFFDAAGHLETDEHGAAVSRAGLKPYKAISGGVTTYYLVFTSAPTSGSAQPLETPSLFVQHHAP